MIKPYQEFKTLTEFRREHGFANIIPLKHAAATLDLTQATIKSKIRQSGLEGLKIENDYFVTAEALQAAHQKERDAHSKTIAFLLENLEKGEVELDYSSGMEKIDLDHTISSDRTKYAKILGRISDATYEICGCLVTVIVHSKGKGMPSNGFFGLAEAYEFDWDDKKVFTDKHTKRVLKKLDKIKKRLPDTMSEMFGL